MYPITPYGGPVRAYATWPDRFTPAELDALEAMALAAGGAATVGDANGSRPDAVQRRSQVRWLNAAEAPATFRTIAETAARMNADFWGLDLTGLGEALQLTRYDGAEAGHYDWHQDYGAVASRKLSLVLQLSDPDSYEGGDLELITAAAPQVVPRRRGLITAFPAWQLHRVTPVTAGVRCSLVAWVSGPRFR